MFPANLLLNEKRGLAVIPDIHGASRLFARAVTSALRQDYGVLCLGDYIDNGPDSVEAMNIVNALVREKRGLCLPGNHDTRLVRWMRGENVCLEARGFRETLAAIEAHRHGGPIRHEFVKTMGTMPLWIRVGKFLFVHAGYSRAMTKEQGPALNAISRSSKISMQALYGKSSNEPRGTPAWNWKKDIPSGLTVCIGHDTVSRTEIIETESGGRLVLTDTGAGNGGPLTMLLIDRTSIETGGGFRTECFAD